MQLKDAIRNIDDMEAQGYQIQPASSTPTIQQAGSYSPDQQPIISPFMRYPLPAVKGVSPDSLRQYYRAGMFPQRRNLYSPL